MSSTCDVGLANKDNGQVERDDEKEESLAVKSFLTQRYSKERPKGQKGGHGPASGAEFSEMSPALHLFSNGFTDHILTWPMEDLYIEPADTVSEDDDHYPLDDEKEILGWAVSVLSLSPTGRLMIKEAMNEGWEIGLGDLGGYDFHLDVPESKILLDNQSMLISAFGRSGYFRNGLLISLTRALRDVWQEKRHGAFDEEFGPEDILLLERVRAADCDVIATLIGWELRSEGFNDLWRYMIGSEEGDMAIVFSGYLERDPSGLFSGKALASAFHQWFQNEERINACDHETLEYLDDLIMLGGHGRAFGEERLAPVSIEILSCLPDKTAYLRGYGECIMSDPQYAGLCDPINQSHFLQIVREWRAVVVQNVPFRSADLAEKIFPGGAFTLEDSEHSGSA